MIDRDLKRNPMELEADNEELRRSREELEKMKQRYLDLYLFAPSGYLTINRRGYIIEVNTTASDILGVKLGDLIRQRFERFILTEDKGIYHRMRDALIKTGEKQTCELRIMRPDKSTLWLRLDAAVGWATPDSRMTWVKPEVSGGAEDGGATDLLEIRITMRDITDRKNSEEKLRTTLDTYQALVTCSPHAIIALDRNSRVTQWNLAAEKMFGWREKEALGNFLPIVSEEMVDEHVALREKALRGEEVNNAEVVRRKKDGSPIRISISYSPLRDAMANITGVMSISTDITSQKKLEEELLVARKLESVATMAGGIAHDFNNLLSTIQGGVQLLRKGLSPQETHEVLSLVEQAIRDAIDLTTSFITFSKGGKPFRIPHNIGMMVRDTIQQIADKESLRVQSFADENLWQTAIDVKQIRQVIKNIAVNACEASHSGGIIQVRLENVSVSSQDRLPLQAGSYVMISVTDTGDGIPDNVMLHIFDPYFSTKGMGNRKGSGLGLSVCHSIINQHDGYINVETTKGVGSTFSIYLPALIREKELEEKS